MQLAEALAPVDLARVYRIRNGLRELSRALRARHPWLTTHQSALGLACLCGALALMVVVALAYGGSTLPAWAAVPLIAVACSIAYEVEHDLIHGLYYPSLPHVRNVMLAVCWLMRPNAINPWLRGELHLAHHRISGTPGDLEERCITNGEPWGLKRLLMLSDVSLATVLRLPFRSPVLAYRLLRQSQVAFAPLACLYHLCLASFLFLNYHAWRGSLSPGMEELLPAADFVAMVWLLPNLLHTFCLHVISSNIHYYGDVIAGDVLRQTQVVDRWFFLPLQLFCFNFGSTHAIHHFWVLEPFYLRQLCARPAHALLRQHGVRFNDLATLARSNRYGRGQRGTSLSRLFPLATK
jgi:hypothetical protein